MNELIELGMVAGDASVHDQDSGLVELGSVVSETKAHDHGSIPETFTIVTTSP